MAILANAREKGVKIGILTNDIRMNLWYNIQNSIKGGGCHGTDHQR